MWHRAISVAALLALAGCVTKKPPLRRERPDLAAPPVRRDASTAVSPPASSAARDGGGVGAADAGATSRPTRAQQIENERALDGFFALLDALRRRRTKRARISHWGDSHVACDVWTAQIRRRLQRRFGDGGAGFVLLGRPWRSYRHAQVRAGVDRRWRAERLWTRYSRRRPRPRDDLFGIAGISVHTRAARRATLRRRDRRRLDGLDLYYLAQPGGGRVDVLRDGRLARRFSTSAARPRAGFLRLDFRRPARKVELRTRGGEVRLFGVDLASKGRGLIYDAFGINGARAATQLAWNEALFTTQVRRLGPQLVVLSYGSNEVDNTALTRATVHRRFNELLLRWRRMLPQASCLVVGPPDQARRGGEQGWQLPVNLPLIIAAQRRAARRRGCAFWDQRAAMGGAGAIYRWRAASPPLAGKDHVHFHARGYHALGDALFASLMRSYRRFRIRRAARPETLPTGSR